jgi:glycosyltransferase involved in cell wall biosynthesis
LKLTVATDASVVASSVGGTRVYAQQLLRHLVELRQDWDFVLYLRRASDAGELDGIVDAGNVRTSVVEGRPNAWRVQARLPPRLKQDGVDLYHSLGYFLPLRWPGPQVVSILDLNVYATARNWLRPPTFLPWLDLASQTWLSIKRADHIIAISESTRNQLHRFMKVPDARISVIPLAADPYLFEMPSQAELTDAKSLVSESPFVLFVGILSPQKNLLTLVRAFARSRLPANGVRLVLAGSDRERYAGVIRQAAASLGVGDAVSMPGFVTRATLRALYHLAYCLVLPSHGEGFGLPLVEAMACGIPIVAARRQAIPEVLGDAGCLFDPEDAEELATLLNRIADDKSFRLLLAARSADRGRNFSWRRAAEQTAAVYEGLIRSSRR